MGWGEFLGKIAEQFQGRVERLKNERERLLIELKQLQGQKCNEKIANRISAIKLRVDTINSLLANAAR